MKKDRTCAGISFILLLLFAAVTAIVAAPMDFSQQGKLTASDGVANDNLGYSVAISGDTAVVGIPQDQVGSNVRQGSVNVYLRSGDTWAFQQKLVASDGAATDQFGYSVALNGNTIAVGRQNTTTGQNRADGRVYIFARSGSLWSETQVLQSSDLAQGDLFGNSLSFDGDTLAVGALQKNNVSNFFQGAVYIFTRPAAGSSFAQQGKLISSDGGFADFFGYSVAVSGDTAIVGAVGLAGLGAGAGRGWAYVFTRSGGSWTQQQKLLSSDGAAGDAFGFSVGMSGDHAVIGARLDVVGTAGEVGSAYIFERSGGTWAEQQKLTAAETTPRNDTFGASLAINGDTLAIGSPAHEYLPGIANHGAVYVYNRSGSAWNRVQKLVHSDPAPDALGTSVAFDGTSIISGAPAKDSNKGAVYVFKAQAASSGRTPYDFDGDGKADLSVYRSGTWYINRSSDGQFYGSAFGLTSDRIVPADYDGDGKTDVAVYRDGNWFMLRSSDGQFAAWIFGTTGDLPIPGDFDGDQKADVSVWRPSDGIWYRLNSSNGQLTAVHFGMAGDKPVIGDFDGDAKTDHAVFRPSDGNWYWLSSSNGQFNVLHFGTLGDTPVAADYDGDGKTDIAVWRPSDGIWYRLNSSNGNFVAVSWGLSSDIHVPADYDGDGKADIAIYRAGLWCVINSATSAFTFASFGTTGDSAVPAALIY